MDTLKCLLGSWLVIVSLVLPGVAAVSDQVPIIASAAVALFLLLILIIVIVFASCYAQSWIRTSMRRNGKVKMPRSYFDKKREAKRRLIAESVRSSKVTQDTYVAPFPPKQARLAPVNGYAAPPAVPAMDKETLVQGWNQETRRIYEEKADTLNFDDEKDEEFHIETTIVDNEVLDVGPYKNMGESSRAQPVDGNVYANPYLYTHNDRVTITRSSEQTGVVKANSSGLSEGMLPAGMDDKIIKL